MFKEAVVRVAPGLLPGDQLNHTQARYTRVLTLAVLNEGFLYNPNGGGENEVKKILKNFGIERLDPLALNFVIEWGTGSRVRHQYGKPRETNTSHTERSNGKRRLRNVRRRNVAHIRRSRYRVTATDEKATYLASALWPGHLTATAISMPTENGRSGQLWGRNS